MSVLCARFPSAWLGFPRLASASLGFALGLPSVCLGLPRLASVSLVFLVSLKSPRFHFALLDFISAPGRHFLLVKWNLGRFCASLLSFSAQLAQIEELVQDFTLELPDAVDKRALPLLLRENLTSHHFCAREVRKMPKTWWAGRTSIHRQKKQTRAGTKQSKLLVTTGHTAICCASWPPVHPAKLEAAAKLRLWHCHWSRP